MLRNRKAQSTLEYAVLIAVVVGALIAIQIYLKRGVQGKMRESADQIGEQFEAGQTAVNRTTGRVGATVQTLQGGETTVRTGRSASGANVTGSEQRTESGSEEGSSFTTAPAPVN